MRLEGLSRLLVLLVCLGAGTSCTSYRHWHTAPGVTPSQPLQPFITRSYEPALATNRTGKTFAVVEFDEQGELWQREQLSGLLTHIDEVKRSGQNVLLMLYVHGWNHNASPRSENYRRFRALIEELPIESIKLGPSNERPNHLMGVYIGWPGRGIDTRVFSVPWAETRWGASTGLGTRMVGGLYDFVYQLSDLPRVFTFWNRAGVAEKVSQVAATETLLAITAALKMPVINEQEQLGDMRMIVIGHSMGGLVVERAMNQALLGIMLTSSPMGALFLREGTILLEEGRDALMDCQARVAELAEASEQTSEAYEAAAQDKILAEEKIREGEYMIDYAFPRPADLIILVNPAVEALGAHQMIQALSKRTAETMGEFVHYGIGEHRPLIVSISSNWDSATRMAFPLTHGLGSILERFRSPASGLHGQRILKMKTAPHAANLRSHYIHRLERKPKPPTRKDRTGAVIESFLDNLIEAPESPPDYVRENLFLFSTLSGLYALELDQRHVKNRSGYWVIKAPRDIIKNHNDFHTEGFYGLLGALMRENRTFSRPAYADEVIFRHIGAGEPASLPLPPP